MCVHFINGAKKRRTKLKISNWKHNFRLKKNQTGLKLEQSKTQNLKRTKNISAREFEQIYAFVSHIFDQLRQFVFTLFSVSSVVFQCMRDLRALPHNGFFSVESRSGQFYSRPFLRCMITAGFEQVAFFLPQYFTKKK